MRSLGMWYKPIDKDLDVSFETHINLWFLEDHKGLKPQITNPYLDIGICIEHYTRLNSLVIGLPFVIIDNNVEDLSFKFNNKENATLVFNENCETETIKEYTSIKKKSGEKLLVYPLKQNCGNIYSISQVEDTSSSIIEIHFEPFIQYVNTEKELNDIEAKCKFLYLRFRIKGINLKDIVFYDSESLNKSFESAFSATRVLDFKINKSRNIDNKLVVRMATKEYSIIKFDKINFLIMVPSAYDLDQYSESLNCREVEAHLWDDYFGQKIDFHKGHVLAYHWKKIAESSKPFEEFSCFAKINYKKTRNMMLFAYILIVVSLGMLGSALVSLVDGIVDRLPCIITRIAEGERLVALSLLFDKGIGIAVLFSLAIFVLAIWLGSRNE